MPDDQAGASHDEAKATFPFLDTQPVKAKGVEVVSHRLDQEDVTMLPLRHFARYTSRRSPMQTLNPWLKQVSAVMAMVKVQVLLLALYCAGAAGLGRWAGSELARILCTVLSNSGWRLSLAREDSNNVPPQSRLSQERRDAILRFHDRTRHDCA